MLFVIHKLNRNIKLVLLLIVFPLQLHSQIYQNMVGEETNLLKLFVIIAIILSAISFHFVKINILKKKNKEQNKKVKAIIEEMGFINLELSEQKEEIQQQSEELYAQKESLEEQNEEIKATNDELSVAYHTMQVISEFGEQITTNLSIQEINNMTHSYVTSIMDVDVFGIALFIEKVNALEFPELMQKNNNIPYYLVPLDKENSLANWSYKNKKEVFISDYNKEYKEYISKKDILRTVKTPKSIIYIPLISKDIAIGVITIQSFKENAFTYNDFNILKTITFYITISVLNAQAYSVISFKNQHIESSMNYAKTIQQSILPPKKIIDNYFKSFVIFKPKDIVSGDFYRFIPTQTDEGKDIVFAIVIDCTGHGVPGAFMSLIANRLLNEIIMIRKTYEPSAILKLLNKGVQLSLRQKETDNNDGMDVCLCAIEKSESELIKVEFSGAKRPLYYYSQGTGKIEKLLGSRKSIGGIRSKRSKLSYESQEIILNKGDIIYLTSDGYVDQNSPNRKRFGTYPFLRLLNDIAPKSLTDQKIILETVLIKHMGDVEQRDDITILGLKL